jgi:hypothetical protein
MVLPVKLFIWVWSICCGLFWLVRGVVTVPPVEGVAYQVLDWLMQVAVVGIRWQWMTWGRGSTETVCTHQIPCTCHSKPYVNVGETRRKRLLLQPLFFCCFENSFDFLFIFSLSCDVMSDIRIVWVNPDGKSDGKNRMRCAINKSGVYFCYMCIRVSEVRRT